MNFQALRCHREEIKKDEREMEEDEKETEEFNFFLVCVSMFHKFYKIKNQKIKIKMVFFSIRIKSSQRPINFDC